jgi:hypothetical protein
VLSEVEIKAVTKRAKTLAPADYDYVDTDLLICLFVTVIDFQMLTTTVNRALTYFKDNRAAAIRDLDDLEELLNAHPNDQLGNCHCPVSVRLQILDPRGSASLPRVVVESIGHRGPQGIEAMGQEK